MRTDVSSLETLLAAQALLYREARLLDERRFDEWLELFTSDAHYWLPIRDEGSLGQAGEPSLISDTRSGMEERVFRLTRTLAHAQNPPSRTQHDVMNVEVVEESGTEAVVRCNQTVHEMREGDTFHVGLAHPRVFAARCRYVLVVHDDGWRIREKRCDLLDRDRPIYNLTFIF
ncbi:MAG: aromatic-ring-hydroxylating dioxygenase subunit beta [Candidatus Dormibacteraeota bacterium]|nr:aromatic-ring-hydroxylating dioxygenase subunit beta [Candidatus Dormibacteraeota bacterium]